MTSISVLLAEDDPDMRAVLSNSLSRAGYSVTAVVDGREALDKLEKRPYDVLVTDVKMPRIDGVELVKRAIKVHPQLRVIFITGFAAVSLWLKNRTDTPYPVVSKPFHLKRLEQQIAREIELRGLEESATAKDQSK